MSKKIIIAGASGFIGSHLSRLFADKGYSVATVSFSPGADHTGIFHADGQPIPDFWENAKAVINLSGKNIAVLWTDANLAEIQRSRVATAKRLSTVIRGLTNPPEAVISASATGYYGYDNRLCTEKAGKGTGVLSDICAAWEGSLDLPKEVRHCFLRFGVVLDPSGGMLQKIRPVFRLGLGAVNGSGTQYMSWISLSDALQAIDWLITHPDISGPVNLCSPTPVSNRLFSEALAKSLKRRLFMRIPTAAFALLPNGMGPELFTGGIRALPETLMRSNFVFQHTTVNDFFGL